MLAAPQSSADGDNLPPLMPPAVPVSTVPSPAVAPPPAPGRMDREFVIRNNLVERYISGRLPLRGAQDFERFCREHPEVLDEVGLTEQINAALRLLDSSGRASPWEPEPKRWLERLPVLITAASLALVLAVTALVLSSKLSSRDHTITGLRQQVRAQPLDPAQSTRTITIIPNRVAPSQRSLITIGGPQRRWPI